MSKVSIIVPVYNVYAYLERCVESIIRQTEQDIEILLIDDGSTDGSAMLCNRLAEADGRITVIHKENGGLSSARNYGLQMAMGDFVCFVDSDDVIAPYYVEHLLHLIQTYDSDLSVGQYACFLETMPSFDNVAQDIQVLSGKDAINKLFGESNICATIACNKMYRKTLFSDISFPEGLINEDEAVAYRLFYKAKKVVFSSNTIYGYYTRTDSITKRGFSQRNYDYLQIAWERCEFFKNNNEERYYHLFLKIYCWVLLEYGKKARTILKDKKKNKELLKEFKAKSRLLIRSPYISKTKRMGIRLFSIFPPVYFLSVALVNRLNENKKRK